MTMLRPTALLATAVCVAFFGGWSLTALGQEDTHSGFLLGKERAQDKADDSSNSTDDAAKDEDAAAKSDDTSTDKADDTSQDDADKDAATANEGAADSDTEKSASDSDSQTDDDAKSAASDDQPKPSSEPDDADNKAASTSADSDDVAEEKVVEKKDDLTIASWGGAYEKSQALAYFEPFTKTTGIAVTALSHKGDLSGFMGAKESSARDWDVVDLSYEQAEKACNAGLLELIDPKKLTPPEDGKPIEDDFFSDALQPCGVASMAWSSLIIYDKRAFTKREPTSIEDFFDLKRFPGKRALRKGAKYNLELALMADGVSPEEVYTTLQSEEGLERALKKLGTIRQHIIWWESSQDALDLLSKRKAVMTTAYSGRTFFTVAGESQPFGLIWDRQIYHMDLWAIPRSSRNKEGALKFIAFATEASRLAGQTKWFPYGPMRKSAVPLIGKHAEVDIEMARYVPTAAGNFDKALGFDAIWWDRQEKRIGAKFAEWLETAPPPKAEPKKKKPRKKLKKWRKKKRS